MVIRSALLPICFFILLSTNVVYGAASTWPAPVPLFHKSPYFNAWVDASSNVSNSPAHRWPQFFHRQVFPPLTDVVQTSQKAVGLGMVYWGSSRQYQLYDTRGRQFCQLHHRWQHCFHIYYPHTDALQYRSRSRFGQSNIPRSDRGCDYFLYLHYTDFF